MGIGQRKILDDNIVTKFIPIPLPATLTASQTNAVFWEWVPEFNGAVVGAHLYATTFTNLTSVDVCIGTHASTASCLAAAITPTAATDVAGVVTNAPARTSVNGFGPDGNGVGTTIQLKYTSGSGPAQTGGVLLLKVRYRPVNGEVF